MNSSLGQDHVTKQEFDKIVHFFRKKLLPPRRFYPLTLFLGFSLCGIFYLFLYPYYEQSGAFKALYLVRELGFALVLGAILGAFVESYNRSRHEDHVRQLIDVLTSQLKKVDRRLMTGISDIEAGVDRLARELSEKAARDVYLAVYAKSLGSELTREIESQILSSSFKRKILKSSIIIRDAANNEGLSSITTVVECSVTNISPSTIPYDFGFEVDIPLPHLADSLVVEHFECGPIKHTNHVEMKTQGIIRHKDGRLKIAPTSAVKVVAGESIETKLRYTKIQSPSDQEYVVTIYPCDQMDLEVTYDPLKYAVHVTNLHPNSPTCITDLTGRCTYSLKRLLVMQGMVVSWARKPER
jgi:hypothetical protein